MDYDTSVRQHVRVHVSVVHMWLSNYIVRAIGDDPDLAKPTVWLAYAQKPLTENYNVCTMRKYI